MRLRLEILRYQLPALKVIWQAKTDQTVADFIHTINSFFPLESDGWGLEDYVLENESGFESLHYQTIQDVFKADELARIRPLSTQDIRMRTVTGRTSIHSSGAHQLDGVVWGRPLLRKPQPSYLYIPSRERIGFGSAGQNALQMQLDHIAGDDADPEMEVSGDSEEYEDEDEGGAASDPAEIHTLDAAGNTPAARRSKRLVEGPADGGSFEEQQALVLIGGTDESPAQLAGQKRKRRDKHVRWSDQTKKATESGGGQHLDIVGSSETSTSDEEWNPSESDEISDSIDDNEANGSPLTKRAKPSSHTKDVGADITTTSKDNTQMGTLVAPGAGKQTTKSRNERRKLTNKLIYLKRQGALPVTAGKEELLQYLARGHSSGSLEQRRHISASAQATPSAAQNAHLDNVAIIVTSSDSDSDSTSSSDTSSDSSSSVSESSSEDAAQSGLGVFGSKPKSPKVSTNDATPTAKGDAESDTAAFTARRQALLNQLALGGVDVTPDTPDPAAVDDPAPRKRAQIDVRASQRLLLGSLGHRAPKNAADRANLVAKLGAEAKRKPVTKSATITNGVEASPQPVSTDPDFWKAHIELTAVECTDPSIKLSTPPFPYYHRWDEAAQEIFEARRPSRGSRRSSGRQDTSYIEEASTAALDYDDPPEPEVIVEHNGDGPSSPDLPTVPENTSSLPIPTEAELKPGDILAFKQLECTAATNWAPTMSAYRVAKVVSEDLEPGKLIALKLARRDQLGPKRTDSEGNRVYEKFEMEDHDGDELDDQDCAAIEVLWDQLVEPKLLAQEGTADAPSGLRGEEHFAD